MNARSSWSRETQATRLEETLREHDVLWEASTGWRRSVFLTDTSAQVASLAIATWPTTATTLGVRLVGRELHALAPSSTGKKVWERKARGDVGWIRP